MFVKDVDQRAFAEGERIFRPEDVLSAAISVFEDEEFRKLPERLQQRVGVDVELPRWEDQSPARQWDVFNRVLVSVQAAEARSRG